MQNSVQAYKIYQKNNPYQYKNLKITDLETECGSHESKFCVITSERDDTVIKKYRNDPIKFYYMEKAELKQLANKLLTERDVKLTGIV